MKMPSLLALGALCCALGGVALAQDAQAPVAPANGAPWTLAGSVVVQRPPHFFQLGNFAIDLNRVRSIRYLPATDKRGAELVISYGRGDEDTIPSNLSPNDWDSDARGIVAATSNSR